MRQYIALIHKDPGSDYGVSFPDLPGVISAGKNFSMKPAIWVQRLSRFISKAWRPMAKPRQNRALSKRL